MRKFLLLLPLAGFCIAASAQQAIKDSKLNRMLQDKPVVMNNASKPASANAGKHKSSRGGGLSTILNSQVIGTAGNLLTIVNGTCNQLDVNDSLNTVVFIHRNDPSVFPGTNLAQYRFGVSKNRGATWQKDIGPITQDASIDNVSVNGRFPQALVFNPAGNTAADSGYLVYSGTWHDGSNGSWQGSFRGRGKLSGDTSTFNVNIDLVNGGNVSIGAGLTHGQPGVFWNCHENSNVSFTGNNSTVSGLVVEKGVWNPTTKDVDWTETLLNQAFQNQDNNGTPISVAASQNIAFDPTGQYGWAMILGDITSGNDSVYEPILWKTTDFGATWTGPINVRIKDIQGVFDELNGELVDGTPIEKIATCGFEADLTVDKFGNPHILTTIGNGTEWSILAAGYDVWDITYDATAQAGCEWKGIHLADIFTLRGTFTSDNPAQTEDNRPQVSRSADGEKIFFTWLESDINVTLSTDNDIPNFFGRAIDVVNKKMTPLINFTEGDTLWGGATANTSGGVFGGAIFPAISPTVLKNGNLYNIPTVFTQVDYNNSSGGLGASDQPAAFWYISNINIAESDFTEELDQTPPSITLNGQDTVTVLLGTTYTEAGATAFDCTDGNITPTIQNSPNVNVAGQYNVLYIATDAAGNSDTVVRVVIVGDIPVADFSWSFPQLAYRAQFTDLSTNFPTQWLWNFGDNTGSTVKNPLKNFTSNGTFNVCLRASNAFGQSQQVCKQVTITGVGVNDIEFASKVKMFPNPSTGRVNLTFEGNVTPEMTVTVYNMLGAEVLTPAVYKAGTTAIELNLSNEPNGLYMVKVQSDKGTAVKPLTIQHK